MLESRNKKSLAFDQFFQAGRQGRAVSPCRRGRRLHHEFSAGRARAAGHRPMRTCGRSTSGWSTPRSPATAKRARKPTSPASTQRLLGALGPDDLVRADEITTPARSVAGTGDHPCAMALRAIDALYKRERSGKGSHLEFESDGRRIWAASVLAQPNYAARSPERRTREHALNAVTNHYRLQGPDAG